MSNTKLIKALRCKTTNVNDCTMCAYHNACYDRTLESIAADELEADEKFIAEFIKNIELLRKQVARLRAQIPKEAHWVAIHNGMGVCSNCNRQDRIDNLATHCRYCGARMETVTDCHTLEDGER
jgi:hypothetical protein